MDSSIWLNLPCTISSALCNFDVAYRDWHLASSYESVALSYFEEHALEATNFSNEKQPHCGSTAAAAALGNGKDVLGL
jgi:hypothetical protein